MDFLSLCEYIKAHSLKVNGPMFSIYHKWDLVKGTCRYTAATPIEGFPETLESPFEQGERPAHRAYRVKHTGAYRHLGNAWAAGMMHGQSKVFKQSKRLHPIEVYVSDPYETQDDEAVVVVALPAKG